MSIQRIPYQKRLEHLAEGPGVEAIRLVPVLHKFAALRLGDYLEGEQLEAVLEAVGRLGVTLDSSLAETASAIEWAKAHPIRFAGETLGDPRSSLRRAREELNIATLELLMRLDRAAIRPAEEAGPAQAKRASLANGSRKPGRISLGERLEAIESDPDRVVGQVGNASLEHYIDAFQFLVGDDPELANVAKALYQQMHRGSSCSVSVFAQRTREIRLDAAVGSHGVVYFMGSLARMCANPPDFSKRAELTHGIQRLCEQRRSWQGIDELPKNEGY